MTTALLASPSASLAARAEQNRQRAKGGRFFVLERAAWEDLWRVPTINRLNLLTAYLVLLAGTGADHRLSKWSAHACEHYAGMGKPRAQVAIRELIDTGLLARQPGGSPRHPHYRFPARPRGEDAIFLPVAMIAGVKGGGAGETPVLRRVRQTGDAMVLRLLVDLYGMVQLDRTHGVAIASLCLLDSLPVVSHCLARRGAHAVWLLRPGNTLHASGPWRDRHGSEAIPAPAGRHGEDPFETRLQGLRDMGALWFEPWVFDGIGFDAEPLLPVSPQAEASSGDDERRWQETARVCAQLLCEEPGSLVDAPDLPLVVLPAHHRMPRLFGVARLRVEADTPGRRSSWLQRKEALERGLRACRGLAAQLQESDFNQPLRLY